jgi:PPM family protein phosphatase
MSAKTVDICAETNIGLKRLNNEDEAGAIAKEGLDVLLVADGMGGHSSGEVASKLAKDTILQVASYGEAPRSLFAAKHLMKKSVRKANSSIHRLSSRKAECYGMGTTLVLAFRLKDITLVLNCGDSRAYSYSYSAGLKRLTTDQTIVEYLYKVGAMTKEDMETSPKRHVLMNALGIAPSVDYDLNVIENDYDLLLLCSDGLTNMVKDEKIEEIIAENHGKSAKEMSDILIKAAIDAGGIDNIAVSILEEKDNENR